MAGYSKRQLNKIAKALKLAAVDVTDEDISETAKRVAFLAVHYWSQIDNYQKLSVDPVIERKFRNLQQPIDRILEVLESPAAESLLEFVPHLACELALLKDLGKKDKRPRGARVSVPNAIRQDLVCKLCGLYISVTGSQPTSAAKEPFDPEDEAGPPPKMTGFEQFLEAAVAPTGLRLTLHQVREGIRQFSEDVTKRLTRSSPPSRTLQSPAND